MLTACERCNEVWDMNEIAEASGKMFPVRTSRIVYCPHCESNAHKEVKFERRAAVITGVFDHIPPDFDVVLISVGAH